MVHLITLFTECWSQNIIQHNQNNWTAVETEKQTVFLYFFSYVEYDMIGKGLQTNRSKNFMRFRFCYYIPKYICVCVSADVYLVCGHMMLT